MILIPECTYEFGPVQDYLYTFNLLLCYRIPFF
jgi:hypothetical protein